MNLIWMHVAPEGWMQQRLNLKPARLPPPAPGPWACWEDLGRLGYLIWFSLLRNSFGECQQSSLQDYIETSIMLQYNKH